MAPLSPFSENSLHSRSDNGLNRGSISGLGIAAVGVLVSGFGAFWGWKYWQWRKNRARNAADQHSSASFLPAPSGHEMPSSAPSPANNHDQHPSESNPLVYAFVAALLQALRTTPTPQATQLQRLPSQQVLSSTPAPAPLEGPHLASPSRAVTL
ncbi:hypothetical protein K440DRAFT_646025 [Wilcoxina mikolae CBS 423.85]|nr:hypothetical protein K440DRAFT_646025 [Wilcoxina mikolae CBS 423.85]